MIKCLKIQKNVENWLIWSILDISGSKYWFLELKLIKIVFGASGCPKKGIFHVNLLKQLWSRISQIWDVEVRGKFYIWDFVWKNQPFWVLCMPNFLGGNILNGWLLTWLTFLTKFYEVWMDAHCNWFKHFCRIFGTNRPKMNKNL